MMLKASGDFYQSLRQLQWIGDLKQDEPLAQKTTVRVGGPADLFLTVHTIQELKQLFVIIRKHHYPWIVIGRGSNLLVRDEGFPGLVIQLKGEFTELLEVENRKVQVGAGLSNIQLSRFARKSGLSGVEFLSTIPGNLGGALFMNAGAHGHEIAEVVDWLEYFSIDGVVKRLCCAKLDFSYRHSLFMERSGIILKAQLSLRADTPEAIEQREKEFIRKRKESQPVDRKTWGSVFVNPPGDSAGRLIESCGLKGKGVGKARISPKHANFIENTGGATFQDLMKTVALAQESVFNTYGIQLKMEGRIIPRFA